MQEGEELLQNLLLGRGIIEPDQIERFLKPDYERDMHDPFLMRDMEKACTRLFKAMENGEKIVVYADYDCDGIPGAVIMNDLFKKAKYENFEVYIPQRNSEGYGLNLNAIKQFAKSEAKLIITIDLGITAVAEVAEARKNNIDVIITDHHIPGVVLPEAYAILNPKTDAYPEKMLCGAGVVFKFAQAFLKKYGEHFKIKEGSEKWMLDMAGLATLSDMVPLLGENRAIAYYGLKVLRKSPRPGLQKLLAKMNINQSYLTEDDIGYMVTPKLNAASRMDNPMRAFELLSTEDEAIAGALVNHLTKINDERKSIVAGIMKEINKKFEKREDLESREVIVIGDIGWRIGILGLVAGKISDTYHKTVFVWGKDENDCIKGSCRSNGSVSVVDLMSDAKDSFIEYGGHELAGGFTVHSEKIHFLEEALSGSYKKVKRSEKEFQKNKEDVTSHLGLVNIKNWKEIEKLTPFGLGNPKPLFLFESIQVENIKKFGKNGSGEHMELVFSDSRNQRKNKVKAISFFSSPESFGNVVSQGAKVNLLATFDLSRFRGREELRLRVVDIL